MSYWQGWFRGLLVLFALLAVNFIITFGLYWGGIYPLENVSHESRPPDCSELEEHVGPWMQKVLCDADKNHQ
ncbi:MAG: hypothetical protein ABEK50_14255 [bacterium]